LYVKFNIAASVVDTPDTFQESIFVMIKDSKHKNKLLIGNIYRSPMSSPENDNMLYELFKYVQKQFKYKIWHADAFWPSEGYEQLKFPTFENPRWRTVAILKN